MGKPLVTASWCEYKLSEREELQKEAREYLEYYHYERLHSGLDMRTPLPPICRLLRE